MKIREVFAAFVFVFVAGSFVTAQTAFKANLDGDQAGTNSTATGSAVLFLNAATDALSMEIVFDGLTTAQISAFHIHMGMAGQNGSVVFGLVAPNHDTDGDFMDLGNGYVSEWDAGDNGSTLASQLMNLMNSGLYFNAHTPAFPGGEIRGQIVPVVPGDVNLDGSTNLVDVQPFIDLLGTGDYQIEADLNFDGVVNLLDVQPFVDALSG